jgi:hypothetical protein
MQSFAQPLLQPPGLLIQLLRLGNAAKVEPQLADE